MGSRPNTHIDTGTHGYMGTLKKDGDMSGTKKARGGWGTFSHTLNDTHTSHTYSNRHSRQTGCMKAKHTSRV